MGATFSGDLNVTDPQNSTTTPLGALASYTGAYRNVTDYSSVSVSCLSDVASTFSGLHLQWSTDGVNQDIAPQRFTFDPNVVSADGFTVHATVRSAFVRIKYDNSVTPQSFFTLTTLLRKGTPAGTVRTIDPTNTFTTNLDVQAVQAIMAGVGFQNPEQIQLAQMDDTDLLDQKSFIFVSPRPTVNGNLARTIVTASLTPVSIFTDSAKRVFSSITNDVLRGNLYLKLNTSSGLSPTSYDFKVPAGHTWRDAGNFCTYQGSIYGVWDEVYIHSPSIQAGAVVAVEHF